MITLSPFKSARYYPEAMAYAPVFVTHPTHLHSAITQKIAAVFAIQQVDAMLLLSGGTLAALVLLLMARVRPNELLFALTFTFADHTLALTQALMLELLMV